MDKIVEKLVAIRDRTAKIADGEPVKADLNYLLGECVSLINAKERAEERLEHAREVNESNRADHEIREKALREKIADLAKES